LRGGLKKEKKPQGALALGNEPTCLKKKAGMFPAFFCEKRKGRCVKRPAPQAGVLSA